MGCDDGHRAALVRTAEGGCPHMSMSQTWPGFPPRAKNASMGALIRGEIKAGPPQSQQLVVMASTAVPESCQTMRATCATRTEECPRA